MDKMTEENQQKQGFCAVRNRDLNCEHAESCHSLKPEEEIFFGSDNLLAAAYFTEPDPRLCSVIINPEGKRSNVCDVLYSINNNGDLTERQVRRMEIQLSNFGYTRTPLTQAYAQSSPKFMDGVFLRDRPDQKSEWLSMILNNTQ